MWTKRKKIVYILYKLTAAWLPVSTKMRFSKWLRGAYAKKIVSKCGKNVNIERNAY